ncbi:MAG: ORF6N domain-containing protein [Agathobacter sp.]|nr:ORF6N domain-containing protein [Agathobacter sp.]
MTNEKKNELEIVEINENMLQSKIHIVRDQKVILDVDLAEIYGYETKNFNRQVKNNKAKFEGDDFMFQLTDEEVEKLSRCKNFTLNRGTGRGSNIKYNPYVFTEQGIYMLMTVLRGELAIKQSRALVRTFKKMKDYIIDNRELIGQREYIQLSMQTAENVRDIAKLKSDIGSVEKQMSDVMDQLSDVVTKSDLADMMNSFVDEDDNGWLMYNTKYCTADLAYSEIYAQAKKTIYVVDNYIGLRTLVLLKNAPVGVGITLFSDNVGGKLHSIEYKDFCKEYPSIKMTLKRTGGIYHDRFIVLDYGTDDERIFVCGASSKDAGARVTSIVEDFGIGKYKALIDNLLKNSKLILT